MGKKAGGFLTRKWGRKSLLEVVLWSMDESMEFMTQSMVHERSKHGSLECKNSHMWWKWGGYGSARTGQQGRGRIVSCNCVLMIGLSVD